MRTMTQASNPSATVMSDILRDAFMPHNRRRLCGRQAEGCVVRSKKIGFSFVAAKIFISTILKVDSSWNGN